MKIEELKEKAKTKFDQVCAEAKAKFNNVKYWIMQNPEGASVIFAALIPVVRFIVKHGTRYFRDKKVTDAREKSWYDPRTGSWWMLRRKLTSKERLHIERRYKNGESLGDILDSMKLLK